MPTKAVLIGAYGNGQQGIKCSLPGFDVSVLADDDDSERRSFNSNWTNLVKMAQAGIVSGRGVTHVIPHTLGFRPFAEVRPYLSSAFRIYDELVYFRTNTAGSSTANLWQHALVISSRSDALTVLVAQQTGQPANAAVYAIFREAIPA